MDPNKRRFPRPLYFGPADFRLELLERRMQLSALTASPQPITLTIPGASPGALVSSGDGYLWSVDTAGAKLDRIAPDGSITEFAIPNAVPGWSGIILYETARVSALKQHPALTGTLEANLISPAQGSIWFVLNGSQGSQVESI